MKVVQISGNANRLYACGRWGAWVAFILALLLLATARPAEAAPNSLCFVDADATGGNTGGSWQDAYTDLQSALGPASPCTEVWVAAGTYKPTSGADRTATFALKNDVAIYGGFAGNETDLGQRDWIANLTVLSGDIDQNDLSDPTGVVTNTANITGTNAYHVVTSVGVTETAVLDGFTITGGNADNFNYPYYVGGGMYNDSSNPSLANVTFTGNTAILGGGILNNNSSPSLMGVTFSSNTAFEGGGMFNNNSSPSLTDITIGSNTATQYGGGMYNHHFSHPILTNVAFSGNTATQHGGGMHNQYFSNPILTNVTFTGNTASTWGGGMYSEESSPSLTNVTFSGNTAYGSGGGMYNISGNPSLTNVTFSGNTTTYKGGGMYNSGSSPSLMEVTFSSNTANNQGGGMFNYNSSNPILTNVYFFNNQAAYGGGMYDLLNDAPHLTNVIFSGNSAINAGGGIFISESDLQLMNVIFNGNTAVLGGGVYTDGMGSPLLINTTFSGNSAAQYGGGMYNDGTSPLLVNTILWDDSAPAGAEIYNNTDTPSIMYSDIQGCGGSGGWDASCGTDGGNNIDADPLFWGSPDNLRLDFGSPAIDTGTNTGCPATDLDGYPRPFDGDYDGTATCDMGAYEAQYGMVYYATPAAQGNGDCLAWADACTLQTALSLASSGDQIWVQAGVHFPTSGTDRTATFTLKSGVAVYGGFTGTETARDERDWEANLTTLSGDIGITGVITDNTYNVVTGIDITNTAVLDGFTISGGNADGDYPDNFGGGMFNNNSSPSLANLTFSSNTAGWGGGMGNRYSSPSLANVTFSGNTAGTDGGGMFNYQSSSPSLANVIFSGNTADYGGGGMFNNNSHPNLTNVTFSGNTSSNIGGGMFNYQSSSPNLANVIFSGNAAPYGGGMFNINSSSPSLANVTFSNNLASDIGGGMYNNNSSPSLTNVTFSGNTAVSGSGMVNVYSDPNLKGVTFSSNMASEIGGGMYNWSSSPSLMNVIFSGNTAGYGGGMYNLNSSPSLVNVTFSGNTAGTSGGGMHNYDSSSPSLANCILWGNTAPTGAQIYNSASTPVVTYSDIQGGYAGEGNLDADPLFVDAANGDLRLAPVSPAIDAGNNSSVIVTTDLAGGPRFVDIPAVPDTGLGTPPLVDMGAYEANFVDVGLAIAVSPLEAVPGQLITYTLTFSNGGSLPAAGVVITDVVPSYLVVQSVSYGGVVITDTGQTPPYIWAVQNLSAGQGGVITLTAILTEPLAVGGYTNTASMTAIGDADAGNNLAEVGISVLNLAPLAQGEVYTTLEDVPLHVGAPGLLANDYDSNGDALTAVLDSAPAYGLLTLQPDGSFVYTPTLNFNGPITFTYFANDGITNSTPALVTITVTPVNDAPVAEDDAFSTPEEKAYSGLLTASDVDADPLEFGLDTAPAHGLVSIALDGSFIYTPTLDYNGADVFTFTVTDGDLSDLGRVEITVNPVNDAPVADAGADQTSSEGQPTQFSGSYTDVGMRGIQAVTITWNFGDGFTTTGTLTPTHTYADDGVYTVTLTVDDGEGGVASDNLLVTVDNVAPALQPIADQSIIVGEVLTLTAAYSDPGVMDTHRATIDWGDGYTDTIDLAAGLTGFDFAHAFQAAGAYTVTVTIIDDDDGSDTITFSVNVQKLGYFTYLPTIIKK